MVTAFGDIGNWPDHFNPIGDLAVERHFLHLTVAAIVVYQNRFLLVEELDKSSGVRVLNQPAGHMEADEDVVTAVCRELYEETGLRLSPCGWLGLSQLVTAASHRYVRINFVFQLNELPPPHSPQDADILALHWLSAAELAAQPLPLRSPLVQHAIERYQTQPLLPLDLIDDVVYLR